MPAPSAPTPDRRWLWLVLAASAVRLALAPAFELFPQEAYYDLYARHLSLSYFDHPPLMAWALWAFTAVLGQHAWVLRLCAFTLTALTQVVYWKLVHEAVPPGRRGAALALLVTPALSVVSLIATPDVPLLLFWTLTLWTSWRALSRNPRYWALAGLFAGLAFDGKYTAAYLPLGLAVFALSAPAARARLRSGWLRSGWLLLGSLLGVAATAPVVLWNAHRHFASFRFQTVDRAAAAPGLQLHFFGALLATQTVLVGVALVALLLIEGGRFARRRAQFGEAATFFASFSVPPVFGFLALSLLAQVKPNWLFPFYLGAAPFLAIVVSNPRRLATATLVWAGVVQAAAAVELTAGPFAIRSDDTCFGWKALSAQVLPLWPDGGFVFAADGYKTSAELEFYLGRKVYAGNILGERALEYDYLGDDLGALHGEDALFLDSDPRAERAAPAAAPPPGLVEHFAQVVQLEPLTVPAAQGVRVFHVWKCLGYRGPKVLSLR